MRLLTKTPRSSQPLAGVRLWLAHPLLRGVADVWSAAEPRFTLVKGFRASQSGNGATDTPTSVAFGSGRAGAFVRGDGATNQSGWAIAANASDLLNNSNCTIFIVRRCRDTTLRSTFIHYGYNVGADNRVIICAPESGNITFDYGNATSGSGRLQVSGYTKDTDLETLVCIAGQTKGREIWRRGIKLGGNPSATATRPADTAAFQIGTSGANTPTDDVETYLLGIVNREWSDAEVVAWSRNPWQIFERPGVLSSLYAAASGAGDLAGDGIGQADATGTLAHGVPLAGGAAGVGTATGAIEHGVPLAGAATGQASATGALLGLGTLTTPPLKNNTGTLLASQSGATIHVYTIAGAHVVTKTGQVTNGDGVMTVTDAAITPTTQYRIVIVLASGAEGMDKLTAT